jgi:uncharacterized protein YecT (DUF1311 family)
MMFCAMDFETKSDSLLNVAYKNLKSKLNLTEQNKLKSEQRIWLKKRNKYFEKAYRETVEEYGNETESNDFKMILYDKQADFVILRVKEFINKRNKIK